MSELPVDASQDLVGQILGQTYEVKKPLGAGGMGVVYEVANVRLGKRLAVKVLSKLASSDGEVVQRFRREAQIATDLGHPNVIDVIDFNETAEGVPYMVMELLQGEDLQALLTRTPVVPLERAGLIFMQICSALSAVHQAGVIHRDLKPGNIFLCTNRAYADFVKVLDFGISKILGSTSLVTLDHSVIGTPFFMAPEQARGAVQEIGPWTDVFAMGSILYRMLSGQFPFFSEELTSLLYQVVHEEPRPLEELRADLPSAVAPAIRRAMAKKIRDRYASIEEFAKEIQRAVPDLPGPEMNWSKSQNEAESTQAPGSAAADGLRTTLPPSTGYGLPATPIASSSGQGSKKWAIMGAAFVLMIVMALIGIWVIKKSGSKDTSSKERLAVSTPSRSDLSEASKSQPAGDPAKPAKAAALDGAAVPHEDAPLDRGVAPDSAAVKLLLEGYPPGARVIDLETGKILGRIPVSLIWSWSDRTRRVKVKARGFKSKRITLNRDSQPPRVQLKKRPRESKIPDNPH